MKSEDLNFIRPSSIWLLEILSLYNKEAREKKSICSNCNYHEYALFGHQWARLSRYQNIIPQISLLKYAQNKNILNYTLRYYSIVNFIPFLIKMYYMYWTIGDPGNVITSSNDSLNLHLCYIDYHDLYESLLSYYFFDDTWNRSDLE